MRNVAETECDGLAPTQTLARSALSVNTETQATYDRPAQPRKLTRSFGLQCKQHDRVHKKCTSYGTATHTLDFPRRQLGGSHLLTHSTGPVVARALSDAQWASYSVTVAEDNVVPANTHMLAEGDRQSSVGPHVRNGRLIYKAETTDRTLYGTAEFHLYLTQTFITRTINSDNDFMLPLNIFT